MLPGESGHSQIVASGKPMELSSNVEKDKQTKDEYESLLALFAALYSQLKSSTDNIPAFEQLIELRSDFLIKRVIDGLRIDNDKAMSLLKSDGNGLTLLDEKYRKILEAAIDNLVDFAAAEEFSMLEEVADLESEDYEDAEEVFERYNLDYASVENNDVLYAAGVAGWFAGVGDNSYLTFVTQGDERVRDSHLALEGTTYPKKDFPEWLIPPIEWRCRCYLNSDGGDLMVLASSSKKKPKPIANNIFSESLAKYGRIFSEHHPYFQIPKKYHKKLQKITTKIKTKYKK